MPNTSRRVLPMLAAATTMLLLPAVVLAHSPSVSNREESSPEAPVVLEDPTLSRAIGARLGSVGEIDWYRMDLEAGDPLVVGMTAPDAPGAVAATFTLLGPGLPDADLASTGANELAKTLGVNGALEFQPAADPPREVHGGLGFINYGTISFDAPETGSYWIAVRAVDPGATGKYVLAPGLREEFGIDAVGGMVDLIGFFNEPWDQAGSDGTRSG